MQRSIPAPDPQPEQAGGSMEDWYAAFQGSWLHASFQWSAVLADLHRRCGHDRESAHHRAMALEAAHTPALPRLLERRLSSSVEPPRGS